MACMRILHRSQGFIQSLVLGALAHTVASLRVTQEQVLQGRPELGAPMKMGPQVLLCEPDMRVLESWLPGSGPHP